MEGNEVPFPCTQLTRQGEEFGLCCCLVLCFDLLCFYAGPRGGNQWRAALSVGGKGTALGGGWAEPPEWALERVDTAPHPLRDGGRGGGCSWCPRGTGLGLVTAGAGWSLVWEPLHPQAQPEIQPTKDEGLL